MSIKSEKPWLTSQTIGINSTSRFSHTYTFHCDSHRHSILYRTGSNIIISSIIQLYSYSTRHYTNQQHSLQYQSIQPESSWTSSLLSTFFDQSPATSRTSTPIIHPAIPIGSQSHALQSTTLRSSHRSNHPQCHSTSRTAISSTMYSTSPDMCPSSIVSILEDTILDRLGNIQHHYGDFNGNISPRWNRTNFSFTSNHNHQITRYNEQSSTSRGSHLVENLSSITVSYGSSH